MAGASRRSWETVVDPEEKAWREAEARQRAHNEAQAAEDERKHRARQIEGAAGYARDALDWGEGVATVNAYLSENPAARKVAHALGKAARYGGKPLSAIEAYSGYRADVADGMPKDEAVIRRGSRAVFGTVGGMAGAPVGASAGAFFGPAGAPVGAFGGHQAGSWAGEYVGDRFADAAIEAKHRIARAAQPLTDQMYVRRLLRSY